MLKVGLPMVCASLLLVSLSGCVDGPGSSSSRNAETSTGGMSGSGHPPGHNPPTSGPREQLAHNHDYYNGLLEVTVFDHPDLELETFPYDEACNAFGFREFNFEDDGDDVNPDSPNPVNPITGRADTVFPGTSHLRVLVSWTPQDFGDSQIVPGLQLEYKPSNLKIYRSETSTEGISRGPCGVRVPNGEEFLVPVPDLAFDPAHQVFLSRWKFRLWATADNPVQGGGLPNPPALAMGSVQVTIVQVFSGEASLDPPHPDPFGEDETYDMGVIEGSQPLWLEADYEYPDGVPPIIRSPFRHDAEHDILFPRGTTVPLRTIKLEVAACFTFDGTVAPPNPVGEYTLAYHGADDDEFIVLESNGERDGCPLYVIEDTDEEKVSLKVDDPYVIESQWAFRILPTTGPRPETGYFEGSYQLTVLAYAGATFKDVV